MLGIHYPRIISNDDLCKILGKLNVIPVSSTDPDTILRWTGHVLRMLPNRAPQQTMFSNMHGANRNRGRVIHRDRDTVNRDLRKDHDPTWNDEDPYRKTFDIARNRTEFKALRKGYTQRRCENYFYQIKQKPSQHPLQSTIPTIHPPIVDNIDEEFVSPRSRATNDQDVLPSEATVARIIQIIPKQTKILCDRTGCEQPNKDWRTLASLHKHQAFCPKGIVYCDFPNCVDAYKAMSKKSLQLHNAKLHKQK